MIAHARIPSPNSISALRVVEIDPQSDLRWEAFVTAHPDALVYHHPAWLRVLERVYGFKPMSLACEGADGEIRGVLPLLHTRGLVTGRRLFSLPRTPVAGPLALDDQAAAALAQAAVERAAAEPRASLHIKTWSTQLDGLVVGLRAAAGRFTYVLELPHHTEEIRFGNSRNHSTIKRAVNKAARLGVRVRPADHEGELRAWYKLYLDTMRWHSIPPQPYGFFKACWDELRPLGMMRLLLAEQHEGSGEDEGEGKGEGDDDGQSDGEVRQGAGEGAGTLIAGSIYMMLGHKPESGDVQGPSGVFFYAFNGRSKEHLPLRPNDAIHWQAIHDACREGFRLYDFGEVDEENEGLARFKSKWATEPKRLYRYHYPSSREPDVVTAERGSYARKLGSMTWRLLPLKATTLLGGWYYRYL